MMKGLLTKEFIVLFKTSKTQLFFVLMFAVLGTMMDSPMYIMLIPLLLSMLVVSGMYVDETSRWQRYTICLPTDKRKIVSSKYLMILCAALVSCLICTVSFTIFGMNNDTFDMPVLISAAVTAASALAVPSLMLPFYFKFGAAKGRTAYLIATVFAVMLVSTFIINSGNSDIFGKITGISGSEMIAALAVLAAAGVIFGISWAVSSKLYESREI